MRKIILLSLTVFLTFTAISQDQSNKGKDFWFAYPEHTAATNSRLAIYLTSDVSTAGTVSFNGNSIPFSVIANQTTIVRIGNGTIPSNASCYIGSNDIVEVNRGIRIQAAQPVAAYAHILNAAVSGSTLLLPVNVLGREYVVATHEPQGSTAGVERCQFVVVGVEDNTTVEITPTSTDVGGTRAAGVPYQIVLNAGDVYQFQSFDELSGSTVKSIASGTSACQRIVVIGSTTRSAIGCPNPNSPASGDNLFQQLTPKSAWGKRYLTSPFFNRPADKIRIFVSNPLTPVNVNGVPLPLGSLINNSYYQFDANEPQEIVSTDPIAVYQYLYSQACGGSQSDPEMIFINPVEQTINDISFVSAEQSLTPPNTNITSHFLNLILKNTGTSITSLRIDGTAPTVTFIPIGATGYSYATIDLTATTSQASPDHRVFNDSGFIAIAYGYGNVESYGYNAGTNVKDLNRGVEINNPNSAPSQTGAACTGSPFQFKIFLPNKDNQVPAQLIRYDSMKWEISPSSVGFVPNNFPVVVHGTGTPPKVTPDSVNIRNGKEVAWYSIPGFYTGTVAGNNYYLKLTFYRTGTEGCGNTVEDSIQFQVVDPPTVANGLGFSTNSPGCYLEPLIATETTPQMPKPTYKWWWEVTELAPGPIITTNYTTRNIAGHVFTRPGTKRIRHVSITTPGCISDTIVQTVTLPDVPTATLSGSTTVCINAANPPLAVNFFEGRAPWRFKYSINGTMQPDVVTSSNPYFINAATGVANTFIYKIEEVQNDGSTVCFSNPINQTVDVIVQPDATVTLRAGDNANPTVCINNTIPNIRHDLGGTFTGATLGGVLPLGVNFNVAGSVVTISGTPTVPGTYSYQVIPTTVCGAPSPPIGGTITVTGDGTVALSSPVGTDNQAVCRNVPIDDIEYTIGGTATDLIISWVPSAPTGITYTNMGGGRYRIWGTPTNVGTQTYTYTVTTVGPCVKPTATGTITVNALPVPSFTPQAIRCANSGITFTNTSVPNSTSATYNWDFGDGNNSTDVNPTHVYPIPNTTPGYTVTLTATNSNGCISNPIFSVIVQVNDTPRAGFIVPEVCINDVATLFVDTSRINAGNSINAWHWNFGDPPNGPYTQTSQDGTHLYPSPNIYWVDHIAISDKGCRDTIRHPITISAADPVSSFNILNSRTLCSKDSVSLQNKSSVSFGNITWLKIYWDFANNPTVFDSIATPVLNALYKHKYPTSTTSQVYKIRMFAHSGTRCFTFLDSTITVYANPLVQFNDMPPTCLLVPPFNITQASGGIPGIPSFSGPGIIDAATGLFDPQVAGVGTHPIKYTFTANNPGACTDTMTKWITVRDTAHATFSYVSPTCENTPVSFTDLSTAPAGVVLANTVWNFGHGGPTGTGTYPPGATFTHTFPGVGNYVVTMHNVSAVGCLSKDTSAVIAVLPNHTITGGSNRTQTVCINKPIVPIVYTLGGGATDVTFNIPLSSIGLTHTLVGNVLTIQGSPTTTVGSPFNIVITTTGNACAVANTNTNSISIALTVQPDHSIVLTSNNNNQSVCVNTDIEPITYTFSGGATGIEQPILPPGVNYSISGNTVTISGRPTSFVGSPFNFRITTSGNGCLKDSKTGTIKVNPYPVPYFEPDKPVYCIPVATVKFNNGSNIPGGTLSDMTYLWDFDDPASGTINNSSNELHPTHFFASQRTYNVKLTARSKAVLNNNVIGCVTETTIPLTNIKPQPKAKFESNKPEICIGDEVTFTDLSDPTTGAVTDTIHWDFTGSGNFVKTLGADTTVKYPTIGDYGVRMYITNSFGCVSDTAKPYLFSVNAYPVVNAGENRTILEFGSVTLKPTVTGNDLEYLWTPSIYLNNNKIKNPTASLVRDDVTYTLNVIGKGGCSTPSNVSIKVLRNLKIPNTFTPNNDGINDKWVIEYLNSYPNCRVQVFTRNGQLVFESKGYGTPWDGTMKGKSLPFDTYYYVIEPQAGRDPVTGYVTIVK